VQGPPGPGGLSNPQYAYVYKVTPQVVALEQSVVFDRARLITPGITYVPGTDGIHIVTPGDYEIRFSVSGTQPNQFAIFINGVPDAASIYGSGAGTQQNNGVTMATLASGDVITLVNHTSSAGVSLTTPIGGTEATVNASITLVKLN
jgi:hypothetical protein